MNYMIRPHDHLPGTVKKSVLTDNWNCSKKGRQEAQYMLNSDTDQGSVTSQLLYDDCSLGAGGMMSKIRYLVQTTDLLLQNSEGQGAAF